MSDEVSASIPSDTQVFDVHYKDWKTNIIISDASSGQQLYALDATKSSDRLAVVDQSGQVIGYSKTHSMSSRADFEIIRTTGDSNIFEMRDNKSMFGSPTFTSSTFGDESMTWKNKSWSMSAKITYTLIDGKAIALAKFESSPKTKVGKLEVIGSVTKKDELNEIAVMILTLLHRKLMGVEKATYVAVVS